MHSCTHALPAKRFASESRSTAPQDAPESGRRRQVRPQGVYPECWTDGKPAANGKVPHPGVDCSAAVFNATLTWLEVTSTRAALLSRLAPL